MLDHNLSPKLARGLQELFGDKHEIVSLRDKFKPDATDLQWIAGLSGDGDWVVISGDRRITKSKAEHQAFRSSRLIGFFLSRGLYKAPIQIQAQRLLALWENIEKLSATVKGGAMFELPVKSMKIKQL